MAPRRLRHCENLTWRKPEPEEGRPQNEEKNKTQAKPSKKVLSTFSVGGPSGTEENIVDALKFSAGLMSFINCSVINYEGFLFLDRPNLSFSFNESHESLRNKQFFCNFILLSGAAEAEFMSSSEVKTHFFSLSSEITKCLEISISRFTEYKNHKVTSFYDEEVDELSVGFYRT